MNKVVSIISIFLVLFTIGCNSSENSDTPNNEVDTDKFLAKIKKLDDSLNTNFPSQDILKEAVTAFQDYAVIYPEDEKSPEYLLKASDIAFTLGQHAKSVKILNRIIEKYPNYYRIESVYYNRASHTDFELRDTAQARIYYNEFIKMFPSSDFVDDAQARIEQNFMSLEELIKSFSKMNNLEKDTI
ncbi:MAG TPA: tetratricopeptide repeat protein [Crocinitomix sp.]|nr:tetratricopeptide repeat protein [Crocinitomix sp.]